MKTRAVILAIVLFICGGTLYAQSKRSLESRVETVMSKFESLKLDKATTETVTEIFTDFYTAQDKLRDNIQGPATGLAQGLVRQDYQSVRKQNERIIETREKSLKKALTAEQYKKWTDEIEPSLRPRR